MTTYNTNLAAEFYVLSMLHRLGADAGITLGNKKAVDIVVTRERGVSRTIDVKGVAGKFDWPADNMKVLNKGSHFYVLVSFEGQIDSPAVTPSIWVVPSRQIETFILQYKGRKVVSRALMKTKGKKFRDSWWRIVEARTS
jgi:hypothetical protein